MHRSTSVTVALTPLELDMLWKEPFKFRSHSLQSLHRLLYLQIIYPLKLLFFFILLYISLGWGYIIFEPYINLS